MTSTYLLQLNIFLKNTAKSIPLAINSYCNYRTTDTKFLRMEQNFVGVMWILWTPVGTNLRIFVSLQVIPRLKKKRTIADWYQIRDILWNTTAKMKSVSWIARLQGVDYCCFVGSKLQ
jgi:hypothetical protein